MSLLLKYVLQRPQVTARLFSRSSPLLCEKTAGHDTAKLGGYSHKVNNLEKRFLVWSGKYKTMAEVPEHLSPETVEKARNKARIRIANYMMVITALACVGVAISGKRAAQRGETLQQKNLEWHRQINENHNGHNGHAEHKH